MSEHRFFVNKISDNKAEIRGEDYFHIITVLRLKEGDHLHVFNYEHGEFKAKIESVDHIEKIINVTLKEKIKDRKKSSVKISAIISLIKNDKMAFVIEKLAELGVDRIIPVTAKRSIVKIKDEEKKHKRWEKIIYTAVKQCGRISTPLLSEVAESVDKLELNENAIKFFIWEKEDAKYLIDEAVKIQDSTEEVYFIIGPEGGFETSEADTLINMGFAPVSIGDTTLRAETAAISAATVLNQALRRSKWTC